MGYCQELANAMKMACDKNGIIIGQTVLAGGSGMSKTFADCPKEYLVELPVFEATQMGMSIGLSLAGYHPVVSVYPRINFLMDAMGILTGELDKICDYSVYHPRVIIRTAVANNRPINPGPQHLGDYTNALNFLLDNVRVIYLHNAEMVRREYEYAYNSPHSTILVEYMSLYDDS